MDPSIKQLQDSLNLKLEKLKRFPTPRTPIYSSYSEFLWTGDLESKFYDVHYGHHFITDYYPHPKLHINLENLNFDPSLFWTNYEDPANGEFVFDFEKAVHQHPLTLKRFFILQNLSTPPYLKIKRAKNYPEFKQPAGLFVGMLARHGFARRVWRHYYWSYNQLIRKHFYPLGGVVPSSFSLPTLNLILSTPSEQTSGFEYKFDHGDLRTYFPTEEDSNAENPVHWKFSHRYDGSFVHFNLFHYFTSILFSHLQQYFPVFSMKARKVDKLKFKHSRGKSGKYVVEWRYVPRYQRMHIVLRWFVEDIILQKSRTLKLRLFKSFSNLLFSPSETLVSKNRNYVHKTVFLRYRNSLVRSLKKIH